MSQNIAEITALAEQINGAIMAEILADQRRLFESVQSLQGMVAVADKTMMPQIQRTALTEALNAAKTALTKIENAWGLKSLTVQEAAPAPTLKAA